MPPIAPFVGVSDIGEGFLGPETGGRTRDLNPGPTKRSCCKVRGSNPGPTKTSCAQGHEEMHRSRTNNTDRAHDFHVEYGCGTTDGGQTVRR